MFKLRNNFLIKKKTIRISQETKMQGKKWILAKQFSGTPTEENIKLVEYEVSEDLQPGGKSLSF